MSELVEQTGYSQEQINTLIGALREQPQEFQNAVLEQVTNNNITDPQEIAALIHGHLNQQSANAEASLAQGGYDAGVATDISSSVGVGVDEQQVQQAAADFARDAACAVQNGQTLNEVRTADPNLSLAAQEAIYEQVAQQQGTSAEEIAQKAEQERQQNMQVIQTAVFGGAAVAGASQHPFAPLVQGMEFGKFEVADIKLGGDFLPTPQTPGMQVERGQGFALA
jgi:hypothetical protein